MPPASPYGLFVSPVRGHLVRRYGTPGHVGAHVSPGSEPEVDPEEVVAIPLGEAARYAREYQNAVDDGALVEKKLADFQTWKQKLQAKDKEAAELLQIAREELAKTTSRKPAEVSDTEAYEHLKAMNAATPSGEGAVQ